MSLRVGIVGAGFGGQVHLPVWRSLPDVEVVAVADSGSGAAATLEGDHSAYCGWQDLVARDDIDLVDVVTPPATQRTIVLAALEKGRHVLCEKPFGAGLDDAMAMHGAERADRIAAVGYQFRFEPAFLKLRHLLRSGALGDLLRVDVRWMTEGRADPMRRWGFQHDADAGGGVGNAFLSHVIDYVTWSTEGRLAVEGGARTVIVASRPDASGRPIPVTAEDSADFLAQLDGGVPVNVAISNCVRGGDGHRVDLYGTRGRLSFWHRPPFGSADVELVFHRAGISETQDFDSGVTSADSRIAAVRGLCAAMHARIGGVAVDDMPTFSDGVAVHRILQDWRVIALLRSLEGGNHGSGMEL